MPVYSSNTIHDKHFATVMPNGTSCNARAAFPFAFFLLKHALFTSPNQIGALTVSVTHWPGRGMLYLTVGSAIYLPRLIIIKQKTTAPITTQPRGGSSRSMAVISAFISQYMYTSTADPEFKLGQSRRSTPSLVQYAFSWGDKNDRTDILAS